MIYKILFVYIYIYIYMCVCVCVCCELVGLCVRVEYHERQKEDCLCYAH